jgi:molybdopterin-guanine dinucleotide biosynthesis protein A
MRPRSNGLSAPTDGPFLPRDPLARLNRARLDAGMPLACVASAHRQHSLGELWRIGLRKDLRRALVNEGFKVEICGNMAQTPQAGANPLI